MTETVSFALRPRSTLGEDSRGSGVPETKALPFQYASSGQIFQQFWFIREGEQGIHTFSRHAFPDTDPSNPEIVNLGNLQEVGSDPVSILP